MLNYSGSKGFYVVFNDNVSVGTITKAKKGWDGVLNGTEEVFEGPTRDKVLEQMNSVYEARTATVKPVVIDTAAALRALQEAVTVRGTDFVYRNNNTVTFKYFPNNGVDKGFAPRFDESRSCLYVWKGRPSCGVALALRHLGMTIDELATLDARLTCGGEFGSGIEFAELPAGFELTPSARKVFAVFQAAQDKGKPWGEAYRLAEFAAE